MITAKTVLEFYEGHPERWIQGIHWGRRIDTEHGDATCNREDVDCGCLIGIIFLVYKPQISKVDREAIYKVMAVINKHYPEYTSIVHWNDAKERTFEEVLAVVKEANI